GPGDRSSQRRGTAVDVHPHRDAGDDDVRPVPQLPGEDQVDVVPYWASLDTPVTGTTTAVGLPFESGVAQAGASKGPSGTRAHKLSPVHDDPRRESSSSH